jgi:GNAT superfamily N-acetyltransferase
MTTARPNVLIRPGTRRDLSAFCELLGLLFAQEADFTPDSARQRHALGSILDNPDVGQLLCADVEAGVAGMVSLLFTISTAEGGRVALLEDMVVHPHWRRLGIGKLLLQAALSTARAAGCTRITLLTDDGNTAAHALYRHAGFVRSPMVPFRMHFNR